MASPLTIAVIAAIGWFLFFMMFAIVVMHVAALSRYGLVIQRTYALAVVGCLLTVWLLKGTFWEGQALGWVVAWGTSVLLMLCGFILYMPLVFVVASSVSGDALILIERKGGSVPEDEFHNTFVSVRAMQERLERMTPNGLVSPRAQKYELTAKGRRIARFFRNLKRFWHLGPGG